MRRWRTAAAAAAMALALGAPDAFAQAGDDRLDMYRATVTEEQYRQLLDEGTDITAERAVAGGQEIELVLTPPQRAKLVAQGVKPQLVRVKGGKTVKQFAAEQAAGGYEVWRSWDESGGIRDELVRVARENPQLVKLVSLGRTHQGRDILALKVTQGARDVPDGSRPAVLYSATQHAREWIATEVDRRLLRWYIDRWRANDRDVKRLLKDTELWFVVVANPDGYQYTFDHERLWRKNLRDNDGDGRTTSADGVDPNRNYPEHFNYDNEGSSEQLSSQTYRGPGPASEPETKALQGLLDRLKFEFQVNYHSYGPWLLYPNGWQIGTATADDPVYYALSGNRDDPAIPGFRPGLSSDVLYVTNGEVNDYAHSAAGTLAWTPELNQGCAGCGFVFPDDEALVQQEFQKNLPFALSVAKSAVDPANPQSVVGIRTKPFYLKSDDPYKDGLATADFTFPYSYGDPQPVQVLTKRSLGAVTVKYRINGGPVQSAPTSELADGERYGYSGTDRYYHVVRGVVTGTSVGDKVEVWFEGGGQTSDSFTYEAVVESNNPVLVMAAEDYTGASPPQPGPGPHYLGYYQQALAANGIDADVYDVDARGRQAPTSLGVLGHYKAVVWYTGDDLVTRDAGWGGGNASRLALDEMLQVREYLNAGGRVLYTGKNAGKQYSQGAVGTQYYDPKGGAEPCRVGQAVQPRCLALAGSGDNVNDVLEYWLGAYLVNVDAGTSEDGLFGVNGIADPFTGLSWAFGGDGAGNQTTSSSFIATSGILPADTYPQFSSWASARYDRPGGAFDPHSGEHYVYSQIADVSYKQLTRTIQVPASGDATMDFWISYDVESRWDHVFVEGHEAGQDDWTTLPDVNGHTTQETGDSCTSGWRELHPQLDHYQTRTVNPDTGAVTCSPTGTTGEWHAASGTSGQWQHWTVDLGRWAGRQVEISISYASDWSTQGLGAFVDDVTLPDGTTTSFEDDLGGWTADGPPAGSAPQSNTWERTTASGFPEGAAITTPDSLLLGFGLEGIDGADKRADVMGRAMQYLLRP